MATELPPEEQQELEKLHQVIEQAVADGVLTLAERDAITTRITADGKITFEELEMVRRFISDKVATGELKPDY
jgi:uncharacterized protein YqhQ